MSDETNDIETDEEPEVDVDDDVDLVWCAGCSESFPASEPMVDFDGQESCSPQCVKDYLEFGIAEECLSREGYLEARAEFAGRIARILASAEDEDSTP